MASRECGQPFRASLIISTIAQSSASARSFDNRRTRMKTCSLVACAIGMPCSQSSVDGQLCLGFDQGCRQCHRRASALCARRQSSRPLRV
jgi:hypothetical protein